ncbi:hypothetical protein D3C72_2580590 [compost metagenome]
MQTVSSSAGTMPARISAAMLTLPPAASVKMMRLCEVGMSAPTSEACVVTFTA